MRPANGPSRRDFLAASSTALGLGGRVVSGAEATDDSARLAIHGGPKAVREPAPRLVRWGEPERERLEAMLKQDALFYWKGPQTTLLIERFRQICPLQHVMTCSSGTAALHIAV